MKVFDLHIGLSDAITQLKKDPRIDNILDGEFPNQFDFVRAKYGGLDIFLGMICPVEIVNNQILLPKDQQAEIKKHLAVYENLEAEGFLKIIQNEKNFTSKKLKVILGVEGVYFVNDEIDLAFLYELIGLGIKVIGLKWNLSNCLFDDNYQLTALGREFLEICENENIVIDLAHSESDAIEAILSNFNGKVIDSHTCLFAIFKSKRNIRDEFVKEIIRRDGLIGINFVGEFVGGDSLNNLMKHFSYYIDQFGIDGLSIGSDFDGMEKSDLIEKLEDVSTYPNLYTALERCGIYRRDINRILFSNSYNFFYT